MSDRRRVRLSTRVVLASTLSGAVAALLAAATAVAVVDRVLTAHGNQRLTGAADVLAGELDEGFIEGDWEPVGEIVADENDELGSSGVGLAVYSGAHRIAGHPWVPSVAPGTCALQGPLGRRVRACARSYQEWTLVAAAAADAPGLPALYLGAGVLALLVGAAIGAGTSAGLARWALRPIDELTRRLRALDPGAESARGLGRASTCEEVELIREALMRLLGRVDALLGQARRFSADAAHELRTPLAAIRAELELVAEEAESAATRDALLRAVERVDRLHELVERLLVLASPLDPAGLEGEAVSLAELLEELVADLPAAERDRVALELDGEGLVRGEPALLRAMVANALGNALKFSAPGPVELRLNDAGEAGPGGARSVRVTIVDHGPGVPEDQRERVFEPFYRVRSDATPGHGLGLALIGHIARAHGGTAGFADEPGGARLRVTLPAWAARQLNGT